MILVHCLACAERIPTTAQGCPSCGAPQDDAAAQPADPGTIWESVEQRLRGATAQKYEIRGLLGYGGMAAVFLALDPKLNRFVAIKVMSPALMADHGMVQRFTTEAITIARMRHPNIVTIFDVDDRDGLHFFAMSYIAGRSLESILVEQERIDVGVAMHWLRQVGDALAYAHDQGIVHRDVKPGNILIDENGQALVADFGIAKVADEDGLTRLGMLVGTPAYMSPEQYTGLGASSKSDQWSLGAVGYEMLVGAPPIKGSVQSIASTHAAGWTAPPLQAQCAGCPEHLTGVIQRMLARNPDERWPSMHEVGTALGVAPMDRHDPVYGVARDLVTGRAVASIQVSRLPASLPEGGEARLEVSPVDRSGLVIPGRRVTVRSTDPSVASVSVGGVVNARGAGKTMLVARSGVASVAIPLEVTASHEGPALDASSHVTLLASEFAPTGGRAGAAPDDRTVRVPEAHLPSPPRLAPRPASGPVPKRTSARRVRLPGTTGRWAAVLGLLGLGVFVGLRLGPEAAPMRPPPATTGGDARDAPGGSAGGIVEPQPTSAGTIRTPGTQDTVVAADEPPRPESAAPELPRDDLPRAAVSSVTVTLAVDTTREGSEVALRASATGPDGRDVEGSPPRWSVGDARVGRIELRGSSAFLVALAPGETTIQAEVNGIAGRARLVVTEAVTTLVVSAERRTLAPGETLQVVVMDQAGRPVSVRVRSSDSTVATVTDRGLVEGHSPGQVTLTASAFGITASADFTVEAQAAPTTPAASPAPGPASLVDPDRTYGPTEITERPVLVNQAEYAQAINERFPPMLRDAGVGGSVRLELTIDRDGTVLEARLAESGANREALETAALEVGRVLRFRPARRFGVDVRTTGFEFPVTFDPSG